MMQEDTHEYRRKICYRYSTSEKSSRAGYSDDLPASRTVWRNNLNYFIEKHDKWSKYEPEDQAVAIIYGSIYGNTEQAADALAAKLGAKV